MVGAGSVQATLAALADCDEEEEPCAILFSLHDDIISLFASLAGIVDDIIIFRVQDKDWGMHGGVTVLGLSWGWWVRSWSHARMARG